MFKGIIFFPFSNEGYIGKITYNYVSHTKPTSIILNFVKLCNYVSGHIIYLTQDISFLLSSSLLIKFTRCKKVKNYIFKLSPSNSASLQLSTQLYLETLHYYYYYYCKYKLC
jgi:hypothetical protein